MKDKEAAATHFLRALEKIPEYISQYKHRIESMERDLKQMMPAINKEWKKETELRDLKTELAALDRKITLDLVPNKSEKQDEKDEQGQKEGVAAEDRKSVSLHPEPPDEPKTHKGFRL